jgi:hypothetical protein
MSFGPQLPFLAGHLGTTTPKVPVHHWPAERKHKFYYAQVTNLYQILRFNHEIFIRKMEKSI